MLPIIQATALRHGMFSSGQRVGVAVSGGADSVFLLHALHELAPHWNLHLSVVHVEHGLRGAASKEDAGFVRALAASFGLPFHLHTADVKSMAGNPEQAARRARHGFFSELIGSGQLDRVATGHTRSDQAETVLYRVLRGSGLAGLSGILPVTTEGLVRPLLDIHHAAIDAWLRGRHIKWREDATNRDLSYARNRLRHEVLPRLREAFNPNLDEALAHMATLAQAEEDYWSELAGSQQVPATCPVVVATSLLTGQRAIARRIVRRVIEQIKGDLKQIDFDHVERVLQIAEATDGHDRVQIPGVDVLRSFEWVRFAPPGQDSNRQRNFSAALRAPGSAELPELNLHITLRLLEIAEPARSYVTVVNELDWPRLALSSAPEGVSLRLELRNWRPGDQYRRVGEPRAEKIKTLFQQFRVPLWERRTWPVLTCGGQIVWVRRFGVAAEFAAGPDAGIRLRVEEGVSGEIPNLEAAF